MKRFYVDLAKVEEQEDGTIKVWGFASSEAVDSDGEIIKADAIKAALPDYMKFGAVREMHQPIAAGTAIEASVDEDTGKTWFGAHVVDPVAVKKVQTKVYKGFSIGGKVTDRDKVNKNTITGIKLIEVSLVDRPANPEATFELFKAAGVEPEQLTDEDAINKVAELLNGKKITGTALLKAATEVVAPRAKLEPAELKKGMYSLHDFCSVLSSINYLAQESANEAMWEADGSPLPQQLKEWLTQGVMIFNAMAAEETAEMLAALKAATPDMTKTDTTDEVTKAGKRFSAATKAALKGAHDACKAADKALGELGYDKDDEEEEATGDDKEKSAAPDLTKADDVIKAELAKRDSQIADLVKAAGTLRAEIDALKAQPLPGKALLKAITKGDDVTIDDKNAEPEVITKADGSVNEAASLIKAAHARGGRSIHF